MRVPPVAKPAERESVPGMTRPAAALVPAARDVAAPTTSAVAFDFSRIGIYPPGNPGPPVGAVHDPQERAADRMAEAAMAMDMPCGRPAGGSSAPAGQALDPALRAFFEPRFGVDLGHVRVHREPAAIASADRIGASAYSIGRDIVYGQGEGPGADRLTAHELAHVVQAGQGGQPAMVHRQPRPDAPKFKIISDIWRVAKRDSVIVETETGVRRPFYRRYGTGDKGVGRAPPEGGWAPFRELQPQAANPTRPWFKKDVYYDVGPDNPLRGYGNKLNKEIADWLDGQYITQGQPKNWEVVRAEMNNVMRRPSLAPVSPPAVSVSGEIGGKPKPGGTPAKPPPSPASSGAAKVETSAAKVESTAAKVEAKAIAAEGHLAEAAGAVIKGSRAARLGRFLLAAAMVGPLDVLFLYVSFFGDLAAAKAKLRQKYYILGFSEGLTASLVGHTNTEAVDMLVTRDSGASVGERVAGYEGLRTRATNSGVIEGLRFAGHISIEQRKAFRAEGIAAVARRGHRLSDFGRDDVIEIAVALIPTIEELLELAAEQEEQRRRKEMVEKMYEDTESMWQTR